MASKEEYRAAETKAAELFSFLVQLREYDMAKTVLPIAQIMQSRQQEIENKENAETKPEVFP